MACWFKCWKNATCLFDQSNNTGAIDVKKDGSVLEKKIKMQGLTLLAKLDWALPLSLLLKLCPKNWNLVSFYKVSFSWGCQYSHTWNTVVMYRLVLVTATCNCWISYKEGYAGLLVLHLLPLLNPWLIIRG